MTPAGKIPPQDWMRAPETRAVVDALTAGGAEVRFVGGCVRDALAGRPVKDVDIATHLAPEEVVRMLEEAGLKAVPTGIEHGTVTAVSGGKPFEITTLREDVETYGRHAKVAFTDDWTADAARRDFTFNAMSCAPDGTLYDPFDGAADLAAGRVRFVGEARARIEEDYLRLLRFFRFQAHFGKGPPDPEALATAAELAPELTRLSGERIRDELLKLLQALDPVPVLDTMIERGILHHVLPLAGGSTILSALMRAEPPGAPPDPVARLAALIEPTAAGDIAERLRLSNRQRFALVKLAAPPLQPDAAVPAKERRRELHKLGAPLYRNLLLLSWARRNAGDPEASIEDLGAALGEADFLAGKTFPLKGADALKLGVPEGPELGQLLDRIEGWWAEQGFKPTRTACLERLREVAGGK